MYPILSAARRSQNYHKVYLNGDILRIDGTDYTVETLGNLPNELNPCNFSAKESEQWYVFVKLLYYLYLPYYDYG